MTTTDMQAALRNALEWTAGTLQTIVSGRWRDVKENDRVSIGATVKTIADVLDMADAALASRPDAQADERYDLLQAAVNCPHEIESNRVVLHYSDKQPGHNALAQLRERLTRAGAPQAEAAQGVVDGWKLVPIDPTVEMRAALEDETPFFCRRALDKSCYEVGRAMNEDWRDVISDDQTILATFKDGDEAHDHFDSLEFAWRYKNMLAAAPSPDREQVGEAKPIAWIRFCGDGLYEGPIMNCDQRKMDEIVRVKPDEWKALVLKNDSTQGNACLTRQSMQKKAIEYGFEYWRAPDSHGVTGTKQQCIDFLQDLLGVEVEIEDNGCQTCNGTGMIGGPSFYAPDEVGEPCPDCCDTPSLCSSVRRCTAQDASPSRECGERQGAALSDEQARTVECADSWLRMRGLQTYTDLRDTLFAVLRAIGYTEEFAEAHPDLKVSEGVKLFLATSAPTLGEPKPTAEPPRWYSVDEIRSWLKSMAYGDEIADELSTWITTEMQLAFNKGFEKGRSLLSKVEDMQLT